MQVCNDCDWTILRLFILTKLKPVCIFFNCLANLIITLFKTPIVISCKRNHPEITELLLNHPSINIKNKVSEVCLHFIQTINTLHSRHIF